MPFRWSPSRRHTRTARRRSMRRAGASTWLLRLRHAGRRLGEILRVEDAARVDALGVHLRLAGLEVRAGRRLRLLAQAVREALHRAGLVELVDLEDLLL